MQVSDHERPVLVKGVPDVVGLIFTQSWSFVPKIVALKVFQYTTCRLSTVP